MPSGPACRAEETWFGGTSVLCPGSRCAPAQHRAGPRVALACGRWGGGLPGAACLQSMVQHVAGGGDGEEQQEEDEGKGLQVVGRDPLGRVQDGAHQPACRGGGAGRRRTGITLNVKTGGTSRRTPRKGRSQRARVAWPGTQRRSAGGWAWARGAQAWGARRVRTGRRGLNAWNACL